MHNIQKQIWEEGYKHYKNFGSSKTFDPSEQLSELDDYFKGNNITTRDWVVLDLACGEGKNSLYAIKNWGCRKAVGVDFNEEALVQFREKALEENITDRIETINQSIGSKFPFENQSIDLIFDIYSSINLDERERISCRDESLRVLKNGGFMFTYLTSMESKYVKQMMDVDLGREPESVVFGNGKFEKTYSEQEIRNFYNDFEMHILKKSDFILGNIPVEMSWVLLRKSQ